MQICQQNDIKMGSKDATALTQSQSRLMCNFRSLGGNIEWDVALQSPSIPSFTTITCECWGVLWGVWGVWEDIKNPDSHKNISSEDLDSV